LGCVRRVDNDVKYFDGLKPIFGKAMITVDGALWQKIRQPQQPRVHPHVYTAYLSYLLVSIRKKMDEWSALASHGETFELPEETWGLWPAPLKRIHEKHENNGTQPEIGRYRHRRWPLWVFLCLGRGWSRVAGHTV
jgi:hypothetical protein